MKIHKGYFLICLTITLCSFGILASASVSLATLVADFTITPPVAALGPPDTWGNRVAQMVTLDATTSYDTQWGITQYEWDFSFNGTCHGDLGCIAANFQTDGYGIMQQHQGYYLPGDYTVALRVHNSLGEFAYSLETLQIVDLGGKYMPIAIAGGPYGVYALNQTLQLDASKSGDPNQGAHITEYAWDLNNDGTFETISTDSRGPVLTVDALQSLGLHNGTNPISLRITDSLDVTAYATSSVIIDVPQMVPIPPAFWLLGSGLIGLIGIRRRFKK